MGIADRLNQWFGREKKLDREPTRSDSEWVSASRTEASPAHSERNEDHFFVDGKQKVLAVADGVSGGDLGSGGEVASEKVMESLKAWLDTKSTPPTVEAVQTYLNECVLRADQDVRSVAEQARKIDSRKNPRSTMIVAKMIENPKGGAKAVIARVGNSRAYVQRADGRLERVRFAFPEEQKQQEIFHDSLEARMAKNNLSEQDRWKAEYAEQAVSYEQLAERWIQKEVEEHALAQPEADELFVLIDQQIRKYETTVRSGLTETDRTTSLNKLIDDYPGLTEAAKKSLKQINTFYMDKVRFSSQDLGSKRTKNERVHIESTTVVDLKPGERLLLCSDGISDTLPDMDLAEIFQASGSMQEGIDRATDEARRRMKLHSSAGGQRKEFVRASPDDATFVGLEVPGNVEPRAIVPESSFSEETYHDAISRARKFMEDKKDGITVPHQEEQIDHALAVVKYYAAKRRVEEITQLIRHTGNSEQWNHRLEVRKQEMATCAQEVMTKRDVLKQVRTSEQQQKDAEALEKVRAKIDDLL